MSKARSKKSKSPANKSADLKEEDFDGFTRKGVIYVGHLPHGFYEDALSGFFNQFGRVTRVKVSRNRQTRRPRGFAYVEFKYEAIAKVAAETMNNYVMFQKALRCKLLAPEDVPKHFHVDDKRLPPRHKKAVKEHNSFKSDETVTKNRSRFLRRYLSMKEKLSELGIVYQLKDYEDVINAKKTATKPPWKPTDVAKKSAKTVDKKKAAIGKTGPSASKAKTSKPVTVETTRKKVGSKHKKITKPRHRRTLMAPKFIL